ncbi:ABC transporter substrate-binding protein [candidate division KSB1 bacterium]|nr:ABC transporter substrate-binding protein [candidate division KSB1 bacterium]NIR68653.1 ABC transporter substrate-binding protein [candidate division KSB1 bacterium]NIS27142.1 ABC transporter substrate-binding protein [candidate division KSB1 bacterium]NIT74028.1 ABC transporter substrate-binding protein [candidate division KSB1 bacterium]NIU27894.1 ABC transporter substrate-binding protein [candidate division KSB1 bacterium]
MKTQLTHFATLLSILAFAVFSHAAKILENSPVEIIKTRNQTVEKILNQTNDEVDEQTKEKLKGIINGIMDFRALAKLSLGKYWDERTEKEKEQFVDVFSQLIRNSSVKKLEIYKADRLVYEEPVIKGDKAKVSTIAYKKRKQVEIVYKMHKVDGQWLVYDMEIDGLSTARNYRDSFYKEIAKTSYDAMYQKLVDRLQEQQEES